MKLNDVEKNIIKQARKELVYGIGLDNMEIKPNYTEGVLDDLLIKINTDDELILNCDEIKIARNLITDLLRELDTFEFFTRTGYSLDEVFSVLKKLKNTVDAICYTKSM